MFTNILVPLDGSPLAEAVLPHAQHAAALSGGQLWLLRVVVFPAPSMTLDDAGLAARYHADLAQLRAGALAYVERLALVLRADRVVRTAGVPVLLIRPQFNLRDVRRRRREMQAVVSESRWI